MSGSTSTHNKLKPSKGPTAGPRALPCNCRRWSELRSERPEPTQRAECGEAGRGAKIKSARSRKLGIGRRKKMNRAEEEEQVEKEEVNGVADRSRPAKSERQRNRGDSGCVCCRPSVTGPAAGDRSSLTRQSPAVPLLITITTRRIPGSRRAAPSACTGRPR